MSKEIHNLYEIILTLVFSRILEKTENHLNSWGWLHCWMCLSINSKEHNLKLKYLNSQKGKILTRFPHYVSQLKHRTQGISDFVIGAFLQVLLGNTLNQVASVNEKRVRKILSNTIMGGKNLCKSLVQFMSLSHSHATCPWALLGSVLSSSNSYLGHLMDSECIPHLLHFAGACYLLQQGLKGKGNFLPSISLCSFTQKHPVCEAYGFV